MQYTYRLSLRIWHPVIDPEVIAGTLKLKTHRAWKAGETRRTPKGALLPFQSKETYWVSELSNEQESSEPRSLEQCVSEANKYLQPYKSFLAELTRTGGRLEYFVGLYCNENVGVELGVELMRAASDLGISVGLDIYPA